MKNLPHLTFIILCLFASACTSSPMSKEEAFWSWFQANESRLFEFDKDQDRVFAELHRAMTAVHPDLTFEFGPDRNGIREFVISAGGLKSVFPAVEALAAKAPAMPRRQIIKYRPRRTDA